MAIDMSPFTRRGFIKSIAGAAAAVSLPNISLASNPTGRKLHGLSAFGDLKYPPDFHHFDFVNLDAPKGGTFAFSPSNWALNQNTQTFNTLNTFVLKENLKKWEFKKTKPPFKQTNSILTKNNTL